MRARFILTLSLALIVLAVLLALGMWQLDRLAWKRGVLADISARIAADPVAIPASPDPVRDRYLPVRLAGRLTGEGVRVLASTRDAGAGYRILQVVETDDGRRLLADLGFQPVGAGGEPGLQGPVELTGNLHWPDELDSWTPPPEPDRGLWFARDVAQLSAHLNTEPLLVIARSVQPPPSTVRPLPISTEAIPNRHLEYVITWFSFAAIWSMMTAVVLWRIWRRTP